MFGNVVSKEMYSPLTQSQYEGLKSIMNMIHPLAQDKLNSYYWNIFGKFNAKVQLKFIERATSAIVKSANNPDIIGLYSEYKIVSGNSFFSGAYKNEILESIFVCEDAISFFNLVCTTDSTMKEKSYELIIGDTYDYAGHIDQTIKFTDSKEVYDASPSSYLGTYEDQCELVSKLNDLNFFANVNDDFLKLQ